MGYRTQFFGRFTLNALPPAEVIVKLRGLEDYLPDRNSAADIGMPNSCCNWRLTKDCRHIEWDDSEKFYYYAEWLEYIVSRILVPAKVTLIGEVQYQGDDATDQGSIKIKNNKVVKTEIEVVKDTYEELKEFKKYVFDHEYAHEILADWSRMRRARQEQQKSNSKSGKEDRSKKVAVTKPNGWLKTENKRKNV